LIRISVFAEYKDNLQAERVLLKVERKLCKTVK